jgi:hypothetical protein
MDGTTPTIEETNRTGDVAASGDQPAVSACDRGSPLAAPDTAPAIGGTVPQPKPGPGLDLDARIAGLEWSIGEVLGLLQANSQQTARLAEAVDASTKQVSLLPPQIRQLGGKVDGLGAAVSEPKYRSLLVGLLGIYDLVDQVFRSQPAMDAYDPRGDHRRTYEVLCTQIRQLLAANEIEEIPAKGPFEPTVHRAVRRVEVADPAAANQIVEVVRTGFRSPQAVLRYADVIVATHNPAPAPSQADNPKAN